jgi:tRNA nucleotidyltransferase (CCA-adding enzyme)
LHSIRLIHDLGLHNSLFSVPQSSFTFSGSPAPAWTSFAASTVLHALLLEPSTLGLPSLHPLLLSHIPKDKTLRARLFLAAALTPFRQLSCTVKNREVSATEVVIREALKLGLQNHYLDGVPALFAAADILKNPKLQEFSGEKKRSRIGEYPANVLLQRLLIYV